MHRLNKKDLARKIQQIENERMWEIQQRFWSDPQDDRLQKILKICWGLRETKFGQASEVNLSPQERIVIMCAASYMQYLLGLT
jgi:hypothetical protein